MADKVITPEMEEAALDHFVKMMHELTDTYYVFFDEINKALEGMVNWMYKKVIKITVENRLKLMAQFDFDEEEIDERVGQYLISDFGEDARPDFITEEVLNDYFEKSVVVRTKSGQLQNGWEQYERRA